MYSIDNKLEKRISRLEKLVSRHNESKINNTDMINIRISISIEDLANLITEYIPSNKIHSVSSIYQLLTEYPNEVSDLAKQFGISRNIMMEIIFDYDDKITDELAR